MPKRYEELKTQLPVSRLSIDVLLALRVLYDKPHASVDLQQEINELEEKPEALDATFRAEWEAYVLRELVLDLKEEAESSPATFIDSVLERIENLTNNSANYKIFKKQVAQAISAVENNKPFFPVPWRQQLMMLLLPVTTVKPLKPIK